MSKRIVILLMIVAGCGGGVAGGYSTEERSQFVDDCTTSGTAEATCGCFYDTMAQQLPYHRFRELDDAMKGGAERIPDDVAEMAASCAGQSLLRGQALKGR